MDLELAPLASRYDSLRRSLERASSPVTMTFDEVESLVGSLPPSASIRQWWANSGRGQSASWIDAGFVVSAVDLDLRQVTFSPGVPRRRSAGVARGDWQGPILDGRVALDEMTRAAGWPSVPAALAAHTVFLSPETVAQTSGRALFPIVRDPRRRGQFGQLDDGRQVLYDDNTTPTDVFLWSAQRNRGPDIQFNHVWTCSSDPDSYTALWNVCCTPAFLAKTTDTHPEAVATLQYRSHELYGCRPAGQPLPTRPEGYSQVSWHESPPAVDDLEAVLRSRMKAAPRSRASLVAAELGWLFSDGPDVGNMDSAIEADGH